MDIKITLPLVLIFAAFIGYFIHLFYMQSLRNKYKNSEHWKMIEAKSKAFALEGIKLALVILVFAFVVAPIVSSDGSSWFVGKGEFPVDIVIFSLILLTALLESAAARYYDKQG